MLKQIGPYCWLLSSKECADVVVAPKDSLGRAALVAVAAPNEGKAEGVVVAARNEWVVNVRKRSRLWCCRNVGRTDEDPVNPSQR